jgi:hypothetical protein
VVPMEEEEEEEGEESPCIYFSLLFASGQK